MIALLFATLFAGAAILSAVIITSLTRRLERVTTALQGVLYGTDENGHPNPRPTE